MRKLVFIFSVLACLTTRAEAAPPPTLSNPNDGIFAAFKSHPLVGIGEWHGLAQELDFYVTLLRDPRFAEQVGNIVLETGDAAQQDIVDRYVDGKNVPYAQLRKVWSDTVGWFPTNTYIGSINVYFEIRQINQGLPANKRIKVWLGEPPIDWALIKKKADWDPLEAQREIYPAELIEREILAKNKKALVIYGVAHLDEYPGYNNIRALLEADHPGVLFVVAPYVGYGQRDCAERFEKHLKGWVAPTLAMPIRGSSLEKDIFRPGCGAFIKPAGVTDAQYEIANRNNLGLTSDALLYLGPRDKLTISPNYTDYYLDLNFNAELARRYKIMTGGEEWSSKWNNPAVALPYVDEFK